MISRIGIVGGSYSGSTLLGAMLGCHSEIFYPGELYYHFACQPLGNSHCRRCKFQKKKCKLVDNEEFNSFNNQKTLHDDLRNFSGLPVIADGSKRAVWFQRFAHESEKWLLVHLYKSPFEFVASSISRSNWERKTVGQAIDIWKQDFLSSVNLLSKFKNVMSIDYKSFALNPEEIVFKILERCSLERESGLTEYWNFDLHYLGGNNSAAVNFNECGGVIPRDEPENKKMYRENRRKIFYDDKWKRVLTEDQKTTIRTATIEIVKRESKCLTLF